MNASTEMERAGTPKAPAPNPETRGQNKRSLANYKYESLDAETALPHALGQEKATLSVFMQHPSKLAEPHGLTAETYYLAAHQIMFTLIQDIAANGKPEDVELVAIVQRLIDAGQLEAVGGPATITELASYCPSPAHFAGHCQTLHEKHAERLLVRAGHAAVNGDEQEHDRLIAERLAIMQASSGGMAEIMGANSFLVDPPSHSILLGNGGVRIGDCAMFNSGAGMGKSVVMAQSGMAWGLGLTYMGIKPSRPLKILHYVGEDDEFTLGQCREGFLKHSLAITGRQLTHKDLDALDGMLITTFDRTCVGDAFISGLRAKLLKHRPDLVLINPLFSYIGGEIVATVSGFLRNGINPLMQEFSCAALIAHHTCRLHKDSWTNMDMTYSGIGGGEVANIPRVVFTLAPTACDGLLQLHVAKRQTVGWKNGDQHMTHAFFMRTDDASRPAWLPVGYDDAEAMIAGSTADKKSAPKCSVDDVCDYLATGDATQVSCVDKLKGSETTIKKAITAAINLGRVETYPEKNPRGGSPIKWLKLVREPEQGVISFTP